MVGSGTATGELYEKARQVGAALAERGAVVVCGGLEGVMEAACRGAAEAGGVSIGVLPGGDRRAANRWVTYTLPTGLGETRNALVARSADAVIAVGGEFGTLSEVALALWAGTPVVGLDTWELSHPDGRDDPIVRASTPAAAVELALELAQAR